MRLARPKIVKQRSIAGGDNAGRAGVRAGDRSPRPRQHRDKRRLVMAVLVAIK